MGELFIGEVEYVNRFIESMRCRGIPTKRVSDGYHTFSELYDHRMILSSIILNLHPDISWKSKLHCDGTMFGDDNFIVGIDTPEGQYTYHYKSEFWDMFKVKELDRAPKYDGHKPSDITRLFSLLREENVVG